MQLDKLRMDTLDLRILQILQENGRVTNLQLSKEIDLSPAPTLERVKKLEAAGLINGYHAELNAKKLGLGVMGFIQVSLARQLNNAIQGFKSKIVEIDEVVECHQITGNFDYLLKVMVADIPAMDALITEKLSKIEEIGQMQSNMILSTIKDSKTIPISYESERERKRKKETKKRKRRKQQ